MPTLHIIWIHDEKATYDEEDSRSEMHAPFGGDNGRNQEKKSQDGIAVKLKCSLWDLYSVFLEKSVIRGSPHGCSEAVAFVRFGSRRTSCC